MRSVKYNSACYCGVIDKTGDVLYGIGDMDVHNEITPQQVNTPLL